MSVIVTLDLRDIDAGLRKMAKRGIDPKALFKRNRPILRRDQKDHFDELRGSEGAWPSRAASSLRKVMGNKKKSRTKKGRLRKSAQKRLRNQLGRLKTFWKFRQSKGELEVASGARKWAGVHQDGGVAGHGARIPKREFVYISDDFFRQFVDDYLQEVVLQWG